MTRVEAGSHPEFDPTILGSRAERALSGEFTPPSVR
jgi:hypothetical protein